MINPLGKTIDPIFLGHLINILKGPKTPRPSVQRAPTTSNYLETLLPQTSPKNLNLPKGVFVVNFG